MGDAATKRVFLIGGQAAERPGGSPRAMGFKAYNLARMAAIGMPVPQAFVLGTGYAPAFSSGAPESREVLRTLLATHMRWLEQVTGLTYGGSRKPLLVSVRSGGVVSMPGMMDTVLNVGLTDTTLRGFVRTTGNPRLVWDSYRRLIQSFAETVHAADNDAFELKLAEFVRRAGVSEAHELDSRAMPSLVQDYLQLYRKVTGTDFPQDPMSQLEQAIIAVFRSWHSSRAMEYRQLNRVDAGTGTAAMVQRMVFGNAGGMSGSGVAFTRNPATGEDGLYLDYLFNAQGEDVVSGRRRVHDSAYLGVALPQIHEQLASVARALEKEFRDMQEFEFTTQEGALFLLQTRAGKRTPWATLRIAVEQVREGLISARDALKRLESLDIDAVREVRCDAEGHLPALCRGVPASIGVAAGFIALDSETAVAMAQRGKLPILVREEMSTSDIAGITAAAGMLTALGGRTSHAAVVARQLDKVCMAGCADLHIDLQSRTCTFGRAQLREGDPIALDANEGLVYAGTPQLTVNKPTTYLEEIRKWRTEMVA